MAEMQRIEVDGGLVPRPYQQPYMLAMDNGCRFAVWVCHRRGGKDRVALAQACKDAFRRVGLYWHCLPTLRQGRKVVWDNITSEGRNLIDATFPAAIVKRRIEDEMKVELVNGSIVQIVGADNFDANVGASPVHVTFSEWALTDPRAYDYVRPILRENNGSVSFITTPRGYNHAHKTLKVAQELGKSNPGLVFVAVMSIKDTGVLSEADMDLERAMGMPDELIQQEYYCDFGAASVGSIVGRQLSAAERDGRVGDIEWNRDGEIWVSGDLGYRDAAAWWFWELRLGGVALVHYEEGTGLQADEWIARLRGTGIKIARVLLPHDATAKTMATRFTVVEQFAHEFGAGMVQIVPRTRLQDRINAARVMVGRSVFNASSCSRGLDALRAWAFKWDDERKLLSAEPDHNWASHGADAFSYGAQVIREFAADAPSPSQPVFDGRTYPFSLDQLHRDAQRGERRLCT